LRFIPCMKLKYLHTDLNIHVIVSARYTSMLDMQVQWRRMFDLAGEHVKAGSVKADLQWRIANFFSSTFYHLFIHRFILTNLY